MPTTTRKKVEFPSSVKEFKINANDRLYSIYLPENEGFRINDIFVKNGYDIPGLNMLKNAAVLDIGANAGLFSMYIKFTCPDAEVHCYEPAPNTFELLKENASQLENVHLHKRGVSNFTGKAEILMSSENTGATSIKSIGNHQALDKQTIKLVEAKSIVEKMDKVDILKIDTEGCEFEVLDNLNEHNLLQKVSFIMLEYHSEKDRRRIDQLLSEFTIFGYEACSIHRGVMKFIRNDLIGTTSALNIYTNDPL